MRDEVNRNPDHGLASACCVMSKELMDYRGNGYGEDEHEECELVIHRGGRC